MFGRAPTTTHFASTSTPSSSSSSASSSQEAAATALIHRYDNILSNIQLAKDRHEMCWQVPLFFFIFASFVATVFLHVSVSHSYDAGIGALQCANIKNDDIQASILSIDDTLGWLSRSVIPFTLGYGNSIGSDRRVSHTLPFCGGSAVQLVGGLRLSQWRRVRHECPLDPLSFLGKQAAASSVCYGSAEESTWPRDEGPTGAYGDDPFGDSGMAAVWNVSSAFQHPLLLSTSITVTGGGLNLALLTPRALQGYHKVLTRGAGSEASIRDVTGLSNAQWLDAGTGIVEVALVVVSGEVGRLTHILVTVARTMGMKVEASSQIRSIPIDPYVSDPIAGILEFIIIVYLLGMLAILLWTFAYRGIMALVGFVRPRSLKRDEQDNNNNNSNNSYSNSQSSKSKIPSSRSSATATNKSFCAWIFAFLWRWGVTFGAIFAPLAAMASWWYYSTLSADIREALKNGVWTDRENDDRGTAWDTLVLHGLLDGTVRAYTIAVSTSLAGIAFLTAESVRYMQLQPLMALVSTCVVRALADMMHLGVVIALLMFAYGVIGHIAFGTTHPDWASVSSSAFALVRMFAAWDYDLGPMQAFNPVLAAVFIGSFMFIVANALLWIWFTVVIESYSTLRAALKEGPQGIPTLLDDFGACLEFSLRIVSVGLRSPHKVYDTFVRKRSIMSTGHTIVMQVISTLRDEQIAVSIVKQQLEMASSSSTSTSTAFQVIGVADNNKSSGGSNGNNNAAASADILDVQDATHTTEDGDQLSLLLASRLDIPVRMASALIQAYEKCDDVSGTLQKLVVESCKLQQSVADSNNNKNNSNTAAAGHSAMPGNISIHAASATTPTPVITVTLPRGIMGSMSNSSSTTAAVAAAQQQQQQQKPEANLTTPPPLPKRQHQYQQQHPVDPVTREVEEGQENYSGYEEESGPSTTTATTADEYHHEGFAINTNGDETTAAINSEFENVNNGFDETELTNQR